MSDLKTKVRQKTTKLRKILHNGYFVNMPIDIPAATMEGQIRLWRGVLDQHLKDLITHHLIEKNFNNYYDAIRFFHEQETEKGQEFALACVPSEKVTLVFSRIESLCRSLREKGVKL